MDEQKYWILGYPRGNMEISIKKGIIGGRNKGRNKSRYKEWYKGVSIGDKIVLYITLDKIKTVKGIASISGEYEYDENIIWPPYKDGDIYPHRRPITIDKIFEPEVAIAKYYHELEILSDYKKNGGKRFGQSFGLKMRGRPPLEIRKKDFELLTQDIIEEILSSENEDSVISKIKGLPKEKNNEAIVKIDEIKGNPKRNSTLVERLKRNNALVALMKQKYNFKCQFCGFNFKKYDGSYYVEVAHIIPLSKGGPDTSKNMLVLCPNHHKMLDQAKKQIISHTIKSIKMLINSKEYEARF